MDVVEKFKIGWRYRLGWDGKVITIIIIMKRIIIKK